MDWTDGESIFEGMEEGDYQRIREISAKFAKLAMETDAILAAQGQHLNNNERGGAFIVLMHHVLALTVRVEKLIKENERMAGELTELKAIVAKYLSN